MGSDWAKRLTRWRPHQADGVTYSLAHVQPFRFTVEMPASETRAAIVVEIRVGFSHHTFTRTIKTEDANTAPYAGRPTDPRIFCNQRYELSKGLRQILMGLPGRNCYFAKRENYFVFDGAQDGEEYRVFFDVRHVGESNAVLLFVQSAYLASRDSAPGSKRKKVRFNVLVNYALENRRVKEP